jgi:hypothetical protein
MSLLAAAIVVGGAAIGGIAYASIPDATGVIHGCYSPNGATANGGTQLNIVDSNSAACNKGQQQVQWNQVGAQGPQGPRGDAGPSAAFTTTTTSSETVALLTPVSVAHLDLPAGSYVINETSWFTNESGTHNAPVFCRLDAEGASAQIAMQIQPNQTGNVDALAGALTLAHTFSSSGRVDLDCFVNSLYTDTVVDIHDVQLNAIQVGSLTTQ